MGESGSGLHPIWGLGIAVLNFQSAATMLVTHSVRKAGSVTVRSYACVEGWIWKAVLGVGLCLVLVSLYLPGGTEKIYRNSCVTSGPTRSARPGILKSRVSTLLFFYHENLPMGRELPQISSEF